MKVYKPGEKLFLIDETEVYILKVCIYGEDCRIEYEIVWYKENIRHTAWIQPFELYDINKVERLPIGFNKE